MPRHLISLRALLLLLVLLAMLPVAGIVIYSGQERQELALRSAMQQTEDLAATAAEHHQQAVNALQQLLTTLAQLPQTRQRDRHASEQLFAGLQRQNERIVSIFSVGPDANIFASHSPGYSASVKGRKYYREALRTLRFSAGDFVLGYFSNKRLIHFSLPVLEGRTTVNSVLVGGIDLSYPNSMVGKLTLPPGAKIVLMDPTGAELAGGDSGQKHPSNPASPYQFQELAQAASKGAFLDHSVNGKYLTAVRTLTLPSEKTPYMLIKVAVPEAFALADARQGFQRNLMLLFGIAALAGLVAWLFGNRFLARPILHLAHAAEDLGQGHLDIRCGLESRNKEIRWLAQSIDAMADAIQARDLERESGRETLLESQQLLNLFFSQSIDGFYIATSDHPILWNDRIDKNATVDYFLDHMRIQRVNAAMLAQYQAVETDFLGKPIRSFFSHDLASARVMVRNFLDTGRMRQEGLEYKPDGTPIWIEGDYLCIYDSEGLVTGHFGIQHDVTERKAVELALRTSEERYQGHFLHSPDSFFWIGVQENGIFVSESINPAQEAQVGLRNQDIAGKQLHEFLPAEAAEKVTARYRECVQAERPITYEEDFDLGTGRKYFQTQLVPIRDINGRIHRIAGVSKDISDRRKAEDELRSSQEMFRAIFDQAFQMVGLLDTSGTLLQVNQTSVDFLGITKEQVLGRPFWETPWWKDSEAGQQKLREGIAQAAQGRLVRFETIHRDHEGADHYIDFSLKPFRDREGNIKLLIPEGRDITVRKQTEKAIQEQERLFRLLFECSGDANLLIDGHLFVDCNEATLKLLGAHHKEEILNTHPSIFSPKWQPDGQDSREKADAIIAMAFNQGSHRFEWVHRKLDGTELPVDVMLTAVPWKGKWILHTAWRDLTETKRAERERQSLEAQIQQAQRLDSLGVLAGGIAHDFNNLLTALLGNLNLAQMAIPSNSPAVPYLDSAESTVMRASELTKQMLAYSGKGRFVVKLHDLNLVVQEMTHLLQVSIPKKISLSLLLAENLPPIEADGAQIHQVILNLVTNAADAIGNEEGAISLATKTITLDETTLARDFPGQNLNPGDFVSLEVSDTGCGISPETMARIFEPFFTTKPTGRGLGLSAMLGILRGHQAGIRIQSKVGEGSAFLLVFQPKEGNVDPPALVKLQEPSECHATILLVDDEPMILETAQTALEAMGYHVIPARDGLEAVKLFCERQAEIALVIMDLTMPRMDGQEAFQAMLEIQPNVRVILSSGYNEQESVQKMLGHGLAGFLPKPYPLADLRKIVKDSLKPSE